MDDPVPGPPASCGICPSFPVTELERTPGKCWVGILKKEVLFYYIRFFGIKKVLIKDILSYFSRIFQIKEKIFNFIKHKKSL